MKAKSVAVSEEKQAKRVYNRLHIDCHVVCAVITLGFILLGVFEFFGSVGRIIEAVRDLGLSVAYYFCELFFIPHNIRPTVNEFPRIPFFDFTGGAAPEIPIPEDWQTFIALWPEYWKLWASADNFLLIFPLWNHC